MPILLLFTTMFSLHSQTLDERFSKWAEHRAPTEGSPQVIGTYSAGCLAGAEQLPLDGSGFALMRPSRKRFFSHPNLSEYIRKLAASLRQKAYLLIGDASPARGGPMATGHNSHQTGLDVDIWLQMSPRKPTRKQRESWSATRYVHNRKTLLPSWGPQQVALVSTAAQTGTVNRIFVAPAIKKFFCNRTPDAPWLYKLRAWWSHEEHIHVRLDCPTDNPQCQPQTALNPSDSGCGEELAWWYSKEADEEWKKLKSETSPREFPSLPEPCAALGPI